MRCNRMASLLGVALAVMACADPEDAASQQEELGASAPVYLALGDSLPHGWNPFLDLTHANANWFVGYPEYLQERVDLPRLNAACPGETSASFFSPAAFDLGCRQYKAMDLLHAKYQTTQAEYMVGVIATYRRLHLITIALGANDLFAARIICNDDPTCVINALPGVLQAMADNMIAALATIRGMGYQGAIIIPLYFNAFPYDAGYVAGTYYLNQVLTQVAAPFGAQVFDSATAIAAASAAFGGDPCAAGLLLPLPEGYWNPLYPPGAQCDFHLSAAGAQVLADGMRPLVPPLE